MFSAYNNSTTPILLSQYFMRPGNFPQVTRQTNSVAPPLDSVSPPRNSVSPPPRRRRNQPGNPNPNAEVIALSPEMITTTNRFVCKECDQGFVREQNLELHGRKHGLPWNLRNQNANQAKRRKVYICPEPTCVHHDAARALGDMTGIKKHYLRKHGEKKYKCHKCPKMYAVLSDMNAHSKICGTKKYRRTSSSRNPTAVLVAEEMTTPPIDGRRPILYGGADSGSSPNIGLMAQNDQNIMKFGQNSVPSLFTNGQNSVPPLFTNGVDNNGHQSRFGNILDLHFGNNLSIGYSNRMTTLDLLVANGGINGQSGYSGRGVRGGFEGGGLNFGMRFGHPNYSFGSG